MTNAALAPYRRRGCPLRNEKWTVARAERVTLISVLSVALSFFTPAVSVAAGWDTPIVHTARHQGMGGTAIGGVSDASATFHNPAGLGSIDGLNVLGSFSLLLGDITASPSSAAISQTSNTVVAPFPFLAAGYKLADFLAVGVGGYPVASGAAAYEYDFAGESWIDRTQVVFYELTPQMALSLPDDILPGRLSLGLGYRMTLVSFDRQQGLDSAPHILDAQTGGANFSGFRIGLQYSPIPEVRLGAVIRNTVVVDTTSDAAVAAAQPATDVSVDFTLPLKLGTGVRLDIDRFGLAFDYEYADQSQNEQSTLTGIINGQEEAVVNVFRWQDGHTFRVGGEYRLPIGRAELPLRAGYVFDGQVTTKAYPSAFGTPPAPTNSFTLGAGYRRDAFEANLAAAYRFGSTTVLPSDLGTGCDLCGEAGDYAIGLVGMYVDVSYNFDL